VSLDQQIIAVVASFAAITFWYLAKIIRSRRRVRKAGSASLEGSLPKIIVRRVPFSESVAVHVFQRPNGTFGYYLARKSEGYTGPYWFGSPEHGPGSIFDTAEHAEEYGLRDAGRGA